MSSEILADTDILIWHTKGREKASQILNRYDQIYISAVTYFELIQKVRSKTELQEIRKLITKLGIRTVMMNERTTTKAIGLVESFALSHALAMPDALIAATAIQKGLSLLTGNAKHFKYIPQLTLKPFKI